MLGTTLHIPASAAGKTVEFSTKHGKEETNNHIVMWVGVKTDKASGEMKGQIRGVRNDTVFKKILNTLKGRRNATGQEVVMAFKNQGMTEEKANQALRDVTMYRGKAYLAKSVKNEIEKSKPPVQSTFKILTNDQETRMSKADIELTLNRIADVENEVLVDYDPRPTKS